MTSEISEKSVWITGASTGMGLDIAEALAQNNNFVFATARNEQKLSELAKKYEKNVCALPADVSDDNAMNALAEKLAEETDSLDLIILSAGTCLYDDGPNLPSDMYRTVFDVNFFGVVNSIRAALPLLKKSEKGAKIVVISSLASIVAFPRAEAYGASKAALEYLVNSLRVDLKDHNIELQIVRPGFVDTPLTRKNDFDMPFIMDSKQASQQIIQGIASSKKVVNFPWQMSLPLRFFSMLPGIWESMIAPSFKKAKTL